MDQEELELIRQMSDAPTLILMFPLVILSLWIMIKPENGAKLNQLDDAHMNWTPQAKGSIALFVFTRLPNFF